MLYFLVQNVWNIQNLIIINNWNQINLKEIFINSLRYVLTKVREDLLKNVNLGFQF